MQIETLPAAAATAAEERRPTAIASQKLFTTVSAVDVRRARADDHRRVLVLRRGCAISN